MVMIIGWWRREAQTRLDVLFQWANNSVMCVGPPTLPRPVSLPVCVVHVRAVELYARWIWARKVIFPYVCAIHLIGCGYSILNEQPKHLCAVEWDCRHNWGVRRRSCFALSIKSFSLLIFALFLQHYFLIVFGHDGQKPLELRTEEESECDEWVEAIQQARYTHRII